MKKQIIFLVLIISVFGVGCLKKGDLNFKNVKIDNWEPDWALPILNSTLTLKNVVKTSTTISEDADGLYSLHYASGLFYARASDYIVIPDQNLNTPPVLLSLPTSIPSFSGSFSDSFSNHFTYTDTSGAQLAHVNVSSGFLTLNITSTFHQNIQAVITFPSVTKVSGGAPLQITANITYPSASATSPIDLSGYKLDMTNGATTKNYLPYKIKFTLSGTGQPITPTDNITANVSMTGIKYSFIDGFIGHFNIPIPYDTIDVGVFNNTLSANIYLRNPKIHLAFNNSIGMGVATNFDHIFGLTNIGVPVNMTLAGIAVDGATVPGQTKQSTYTIDSTNSSVQTMFNPAPNRVIYNGRVAINPSPATSYNFVTDSSYISLTADAELPAWFKIIDFALQDTLPLSLPPDTSLVQKAEFKLLMDNAFPLYGRVQLYFVDAGYHVLDSLVTSGGDIIKEAPVDNYGKVTGHTSAVSTFYMEHNHYNAMAPNVKYCFVTGRLKTSGGSDIKIFSVDNLVVKLACRFTLNVSATKL